MCPTVADEEEGSSEIKQAGSGPQGQPLEHTLCGNWRPSLPPKLACSNRASMACSKCGLVQYCSKTCLRKHKDVHRHLCSTIIAPDWPPCRRAPQEKDLTASHPPTIPNPALPVYGLLQDLGSSFRKVSPNSESTSSPSTLQLPAHLLFLFPSAYDLRNVLQTICQIPDHFRGHATFFINSADRVLAARDLLNLELLRHHGSDGIDAAIAVWYSATLTKAQACMFSRAIQRILHKKEHTHVRIYDAGFAPSSVRSSLRADLGTDVIMFLLHMSKDRGCPLEPKEYCDGDFMDDENAEHMQRFSLPAHFAAWKRFCNKGLLLPFGACDSAFEEPNMVTLRYSSENEIMGARYDNDVLCGWHIPELINSGIEHGASTSDLYGCLFFHLRGMMQTFLQRTCQCRIEIRLTRIAPKLLSGIFNESGIKFHRIDACPLAHGHTDGITGLNLLETVNMYGRLLEKDVSMALRSLLVTSSLTWVNSVGVLKLVLEQVSIFKRLRVADGDTDQKCLFQTMVMSPQHYRMAAAKLCRNITPVVVGYLHLYSESYLQFLENLKGTGQLEQIGLQQMGLHRLLSPVWQLPLSSLANGTIEEAMKRHEKDSAFYMMFYFHMIFSGFTFLERSQEWGWVPGLDEQTSRQGIIVGGSAGVETDDGQSRIKQDGHECVLPSIAGQAESQCEATGEDGEEQACLPLSKEDDPVENLLRRLGLDEAFHGVCMLADASTSNVSSINNNIS